MNRFLRVLTVLFSVLSLGITVAALIFSGSSARLLAVTLLLAGILAGLLAVVLVLHRRGSCESWLGWVLGLVLTAQLCLAMVCCIPSRTQSPSPTLSATVGTTAAPTQPPVTAPATEPTEAPTEPTEPPPPPFAPSATGLTNPENFGMAWDIFSEGEILESYQRPESVFMGPGENYFALPGVATFRGNNYRSDPTYGTAPITQGKMDVHWVRDVGYIEEPEWIGCGWTGQPLVVQWDEQTRMHMNLYEDKRLKEGLVEVIYTKMDGYVHFFDLEDGTPTRESIYLGMVFKGSGALDPRGYPLLYVGSGLTGATVQQMYIIDLLTGQVLHTQTGADSLTLRWWFAFDASPLVDAATDTLIWPGESGILYTIRLNAHYDREAGTVSVAPEPPVKTRYTSNYSKKFYRSLGYECSPVVVENYLYLGDNSGMALCVDLNTMELVWAQDVQDDINSTPLFDWGEDGRGYLYMAPSLEYAGNTPVPVYKLDAQTGEVLWQQSFSCRTGGDGSGGILSSPLLGRKGTDIQGMLFYAVSHCPSMYTGQLVALDEATGQILWQQKLNGYTWSSPVALYTPEGKAYLFLSDVNGNARLYDGATGEILDTYAFGETVEASPVVYENTLVLGTRASIYLIKVS